MQKHHSKLAVQSSGTVPKSPEEASTKYALIYEMEKLKTPVFKVVEHSLKKALTNNK